jgi:large subunit ribosomal protein L24
MPAKMRIKSGDEVKVIAGSDRGRIAKVLRVIPSERKVVVEGVHRVTRHTKPTGGQPGGTVQKDLPIDASNVALWDSKAGRTVKVARVRVEGKGTHRVNRKTGEPIDNR